jgi:hypothetical protein
VPPSRRSPSKSDLRQQRLEGRREPEEVHTKATVWHLLDREGQTVETGKTATTGPALTTLVRRFADQDELTVGQEVGKMAYLVHDVLTAAKVRVLSFNAWHLRMVASSRKKTDRRDAYWLAKILTGMMPHPVYIPTGEIRELRGLLSRRVAIVGERKRSRTTDARGAEALATTGARLPAAARCLESGWRGP